MEVITSNNEARSAAAILSAKINCMCNTNKLEEILDAFCKSKDLLINIYKYNVDRVGGK